MSIRRSHDVQILAEGTFRIVLTSAGRVAAVIALEESALGPLQLLFAVQEPPPQFQTGGLFDDVGHAISHTVNDVGNAAGHAAEQTFNAAAKVATTVARPAFNVARDAAASGAQLIAGMPFVPQAERDRIAAAARVIMRARMGDVNAKDFIRTVANAAKSGVEAARVSADSLLSGTRVVAHVLDTPLALAEKVPLIGGTLHALDPFQKLEKVATAIQRGDFQALKNVATDDLRLAQSVVSLVPGIGSGVGAAIGTGLAVLDGGGPLDVAIQAAYGAIPIPPGIREVTDAVLASILSLAHQGSVTDAALAASRNAVPAGLPRDVFDTLAQLVVKRVPVQRAAEALVSHYVERYVPAAQVPAPIADAAARLAGGAPPGALSVAGRLAPNLFGAR